jgi:hypothetical protein
LGQLALGRTMAAARGLVFGRDHRPDTLATLTSPERWEGAPARLTGRLLLWHSVTESPVGSGPA